MAECAGLLDANIRRAAALVESFKRVAVDQASGERRVLDLRTTIDEVLFSLRPRLKCAAAARGAAVCRWRDGGGRDGG